MKTSLCHSIAFLTITLCVSATADTIYSNLQNIAIPTDFTGVSVSVNGGIINPFFGGVGVANNNLFQPVRDGTGNLDTIQNLAVGSIIDASRLFSTGSGGSQDHLGTTFTSGSEGFIGFKTGAGNYGWMRVVFTGNTAGAVIKDWAYDNSGAAINVGRVQQGEVINGNSQLVTLSPGTGESFTLGSQITDNGAIINSVAKTGEGTTILTGSSYTGTTSINGGRLVLSNATSFSSPTASITSGTLELNRTGSNWAVATEMGGGGNLEKTGTGTVVLTGASTGFTGITTVSAGTLWVNGTLGSSSSTLNVGSNGTLGGNGSVGGGATINGTFAPGNSIGTLNIGGDLGLNGISDFEISAFDLTSDLASIGGLLTFGGILNVTNTNGTLDNGQVFNLFDWAGSSSGTFSSINLPGLDTGLAWDTSALYTNGTIAVVPEPRAAFIGALGLLALLRRRRN